MSKNSEINLSDFISSTLVDIAKGVQQANKAIQDPGRDTTPYFVLKGINGGNSNIPNVGFDIAVSASKNENIDAGITVITALINGGVKAETGNDNAVAHRIKFEVGLSSNYTGTEDYSS